MIDFSAVMEVLKNGSDQDIVAGMRAGSIPSQMAIAELQTRAKTRTAAAGQPPQQSVHGALEENEGPQAVPDVPNQPQMQTPPKVQGLAAGGLVSFKHGGQVRGYAEGGAVAPRILPWMELQANPRTGRSVADDIRAGYEKYNALPEGGLYDYNDQGVPTYTPKTPFDSRVSLPPEPKSILDRDTAGIGTNLKFGGVWASQPPGILGRPAIARSPAQSETPLVLDPKYRDVGADAGAGSEVRVSRRAGTAGGVGIGSFDIPGVNLPDAPNYDKYRDNTTEDSAGKSYDEGVGSNEGLTKREARIADKEAALTRDSERAPWLALMKAGLGMASSKNRSLLGAAGEGGLAGLTDYTNAQEGLNRRDDALFDRRSQVEDATRAEKLARFGFVQGQVGKAGDTNRNLGVKGLEQGYEGSLKRMDLDARRNETMARLKQDDMASRRSYDANMAGVNATRAAATKLSDQERFFQRAIKDPAFLKRDANGTVIPDIEKINTAYFTGKGSAQLYGADQRSVASERAGLIKMLAAEYDPVQRAILQQQLDALASGGTGSPYADAIPANANLRK